MNQYIFRFSSIALLFALFLFASTCKKEVEDTGNPPEEMHDENNGETEETDEESTGETADETPEASTGETSDETSEGTTGDTVEETPEDEPCDLQEYAGDWNFVLNSDSSTLYTGVIHKFSDEIINVHYQPETEYNYFIQMKVDCEEEEIVYMLLPAGNHGTTTIEGTITETELNYLRTTIIDFGMPDTTITHIVGTRVE